MRTDPPTAQCDWPSRVDIASPKTRGTPGSGAGVPKTLTAAGIGVVPAQALLRRRAGPGRGGGRGDEADRRAGGDGAAGVPTVPARTADPHRARRNDDRPTVHRPMDGRTVNGPVDRRAMARTTDGRAMDGRMMRRRVA